MRRLVLLAATLALPLAAAPAQAAAPDPRLDAFRAACMPNHREPAKRPAVFRREGWTPAADTDSPMLAEVMRLARAEGEEGKADGMASEMSVWRKAIGDRTAFLVLTTVRSEYVSLTGCYLYDFGALTGIDPTLINAWVAESPAQTVDRAGLAAQIWNVESIDGVLDLQNSLVAPGSQAARIVGFHGVSIKMTSGVEEPS